MASYNRICYLCGDKYEYCPDCANHKNAPYYMQTFCSESCKTVFDTCTKFNMQKLTKEEAAATLAQCDLSRLESFKECAKRDIAVITAPLPKPKRRYAPSKIVEEVIEDAKEDQHDLDGE